MLKKWVEYLADPGSKGPLELQSFTLDGERVVEGELLSATGGRYPILRGVPRFVSETIYDESGENSSETVQTGRSFGDKWREKGSRELGRSKAEIETLEEVFLAMLGAESRKELGDLFQDGMMCLNAGCGVAWSEYLFNVNTNVHRFAVDLSLAVEVAYEKTKALDNVFVAQADVRELPFREQFFNIIFSGGVLHHTGDAEGAFAALCRHLKPGGIIGIYIYCVKPFLRELADKEIRAITTEISFEECLEFSGKITRLGKALRKFKDPLLVEDDIPLLGIKKGEYGLQKFIYDHFLKCFFSEELGYDISVLTNVDWYHPKHASHHTREEVAGWFEENRIADAQFIQPEGWEHSGYFVSGRKAH